MILKTILLIPKRCMTIFISNLIQQLSGKNQKVVTEVYITPIFQTISLINQAFSCVEGHG